MAKRTKRACSFTVPYSSREIHKDGKPFITITRANDASPAEVDRVSRRIAKLLCGRR